MLNKTKIKMEMEKSRGIPTVGPRKICFRSRNEAKWAWLFELLCWSWIYEPYDLPGYLPDFSLVFDKIEVIVEVKPNVLVPELANYFQNIPIESDSQTGKQISGKPFVILSSRLDDNGLVGLVRLEGRIHELYIGKSETGYQLCYFHESELEPLASRSFVGDQIMPVRRRPQINRDPEFLFELWSEAQNKAQWVPESVGRPDMITTIAEMMTAIGIEKGNSVTQFFSHISTGDELLKKGYQELYKVYLEFCTARSLRVVDILDFRLRFFHQFRF